MAAGTATVTGKTGTGNTMTAQLFTNIRVFAFDCIAEILELVDTSGVITKVAIGAQNTITVTVNASRVYTLTVS